MSTCNVEGTLPFVPGDMVTVICAQTTKEALFVGQQGRISSLKYYTPGSVPDRPSLIIWFSKKNGFAEFWPRQVELVADHDDETVPPPGQ